MNYTQKIQELKKRIDTLYNKDNAIYFSKEEAIDEFRKMSMPIKKHTLYINTEFILLFSVSNKSYKALADLEESIMMHGEPWTKLSAECVSYYSCGWIVKTVTFKTSTEIEFICNLDYYGTEWLIKK